MSGIVTCNGAGGVWAVNPNLFLDFAACESSFIKGGSGLNSAVWGKEPPVCLPVDEWPSYKPSMAAIPTFTSWVTRHGIKRFHLFNTHHDGTLLSLYWMVYRYWLYVWILSMGFVDLGGLLNFDSYRLKQTLKEQSWWSNQYLLHSPT